VLLEQAAEFLSNQTADRFWVVFRRQADLRSVQLFSARSVSRNETDPAAICTPRMHRVSALNRIMSGGRPPLDSPSPSGLIRFAASRSATTLVTVGALIPEARTRSALEHDPASRRSFRMVRAFVRRSSDGLPTAIGSFFTRNSFKTAATIRSRPSQDQTFTTRMEQQLNPAQPEIAIGNTLQNQHLSVATFFTEYSKASVRFALHMNWIEAGDGSSICRQQPIFSADALSK